MRLMVSALSAIALTACSLLLERTQCTRDADCVSKGAEFEGTVCSAGLCASPSASNGGATDAGPVDTCAHTAECIAQLGEHAVCLTGPGRRCEKLTSEDCAEVIGDERKDNPFVIGVLVDTSSEASTDTVTGAALAMNDFKQALAGVPLASRTAPRPLVMVVCAEQINAVRAARHLVNTLDVPAIIGPSESVRLREVAEKVTIPGGVLLVSPSARSQQITALADQGLVFRTAPSDVLAGRVIGLFANVLSQVRGRVVGVFTDSDLGGGLSAGLELSLALKGMPLAQNKMDGSYVALSLAPSAEDAERVAVDVAAAQPEVVVLAGGPEQAALVDAIEGALPPVPSARPTYLLAEQVASPQWLASLTNRPSELLSRIRVVFADNQRSLQFQTFGRLAAGVSSTLRFFEAAKAYDAVYTVSLAAIPGTDERSDRVVRGRQMAESISAFLLQGDPAAVGALSLPSAVARLRVQSTIDLQGASSPLDFDRAGDVETNMEIGCLHQRVDGQVVLVPAPGYYRAGTNGPGGLEGVAFNCL